MSTPIADTSIQGNELVINIPQCITPCETDSGDKVITVTTQSFQINNTSSVGNLCSGWCNGTTGECNV